VEPFSGEISSLPSSLGYARTLVVSTGLAHGKEATDLGMPRTAGYGNLHQGLPMLIVDVDYKLQKGVISLRNRHLFLTPQRGLSIYSSIWIAIVEKHTGCSLAMPGDKLIALSGIARLLQEAFEVHTDCKYIAGLWDCFLPFELLWRVKHDKVNSKGSSRTPIYTAPTWSWASNEGQIRFDWTSGNQSHAPSTAVVVDVQVNASNHKGYGRVTSGCIRLRGRMALLTWHKRSYNPTIEFLELTDGRSRACTSRAVGHMHCDDRSGTDPSPCPHFYFLVHDDNASIYGLRLQRVDHGNFQRIGIWRVYYRDFTDRNMYRDGCIFRDRFVEELETTITII